MAGEFLDPSQWPLWLQSALMDAPKGPRPTVPIDLENSEPGAAAAYRMQQAVRPDFGRPGDGPTVPQVLMSAMPGGMFSRAIAAAPKTAAATLGLTGLATGATEAGEQPPAPFTWTDPNQERVQRLKTIDKEIEKEATRKTPSAAGTQKARMDSLAAEKVKLIDAQTGDMNAARSAFQTAQEDARVAAAEKKRQETSFFDVVPGTRAAISAAAPVLSYFGGKFAGKRLGMGGAMGAGAVGGGLEGFLSQYLPTEIDMGLPRTSPTRQAAAQDLTDPAYWARLAAVSGGNAALGAYGAFRGALGRRAPLPTIFPPNTEPGAPPSPPMPTAPMSPTLGGGPSMPGMMSAPGTLPAAAPLPSPSPTPMLPQPRTPPRLIQETEHGLRDLRTGRFTTPTLGLD